jgi:hypothetical protein
MTHYIEVEPDAFRKIKDGEQTYLVLDERDDSRRSLCSLPEVGDTVVFREWRVQMEYFVMKSMGIPGQRTGKMVDVKVTCKTTAEDEPGLQRDFCIIGFKLPESDEDNFSRDAQED